MAVTEARTELRALIRDSIRLYIEAVEEDELLVLAPQAYALIEVQGA